MSVRAQDQPRMRSGRPAGDAWIAEVLREHQQLGPSLPEIDPDELLNILYSIMRPFGSGRRFFLRRSPGGGYVF